jgi:hypothetical protein
MDIVVWPGATWATRIAMREVVSPNIPTVPQGGAKAAALKKNLEKIKLPQGFHIGLYAIVPDARHMAVGPQGIVTFVGTRKAQVYAVTDRSKSGVAEERLSRLRRPSISLFLTAPVSRKMAFCSLSNRTAC